MMINYVLLTIAIFGYVPCVCNNILVTLNVVNPASFIKVITSTNGHMDRIFFNAHSRYSIIKVRDDISIVWESDDVANVICQEALLYKSRLGLCIINLVITVCGGTRYLYYMKSNHIGNWDPINESQYSEVLRRIIYDRLFDINSSTPFCIKESRATPTSNTLISYRMRHLYSVRKVTDGDVCVWISNGNNHCTNVSVKCIRTEPMLLKLVVYENTTYSFFCYEKVKNDDSLTHQWIQLDVVSYLKRLERIMNECPLNIKKNKEEQKYFDVRLHHPYGAKALIYMPLGDKFVNKVKDGKWVIWSTNDLITKCIDIIVYYRRRDRALCQLFITDGNNNRYRFYEKEGDEEDEWRELESEIFYDKLRILDEQYGE